MLLTCFLFILLLFFLLPESYWQQCNKNIDNFSLRLKNRKRFEIRKFSHYLDQVVFLSRIGKEVDRTDMVCYQPYSEILQQLLTMKSQVGLNISSQLQLLKQDIHEEILFVDQKNSIVRGAHAQFFMMALIIFSFQLLSAILINISFDYITAIFCLSIEMIGFLLFHFFSARKMAKIFREVHLLQGFFCHSESLIYGNLPANRVMQELSKKQPEVKCQKEKEIMSQLFYLIYNWQQSGAPIREEFKLLKADLFHYRRELMLSAKKYLDLMVFITLVLFFLSSYFLSLRPLFQVIFIA